MAVWYARDNSTVAFAAGTTSSALTVGTVGWSAMTGWSGSTSIAPGTLRRQNAGGAVFTASQTTTTLTVTAVTSGTIYLGMLVTTGTSSLIQVTAYGSGTGGTGTYTVSTSASVSSTSWTGGFNAANPRAFVATQSATGTTGTTEPNWTITKGAATTDNTVTWIECTGQPAVNGDMTNTPRSSSVRSTSPGRGKIILNNAATHIFIQTSAAGTCGVGEPTYVTTAVGNTTTDSTVTWTYIGTSYSNWAAPFAYLSHAFGTSWAAVGDSIYVGDDHSEIVAYNYTITPPAGTGPSPNLIYSIDHTLSLPVSSGGLKSGAVVATSTASSTTFTVVQGYVHFFGITFNCGNTSTASSLILGAVAGSAGWHKFENCLLKLGNTNAGSSITFGGNTSSTYTCELTNTAVQFGAAGQGIKAYLIGKLIWRNTASAVLGTAPTSLFTTTSNGVIIVEGVDLSGATNTLVAAGTTAIMGGLFYLKDCKIAGGTTIAATPVDLAGPYVDAIKCSSSASNYLQRRHWYQGTLTEETTIIRTLGATDNTTGISWKLTTTANTKWVAPFETFPIAVWSATVNSQLLVTVHGITNSASLPNNDDIWMDVCYFGYSTHTQGTWKTETKSNNIGTATALTADSTSAWDGVATTRQNSHAYALGDVIKVSSNSGRIFFCTTAGTTAGSLPGGYASAVDGGSVTDSTAIFRAGMRFTMDVTLSGPTPQLAGYLRAYIKVAKASSTYYVDPLLAITTISGTSLSPPSGYSYNQLIFEDNFTSPSLDTTKWHPWIGETSFGRWSNLGNLASPYSGVNCTGAACVTSSFNCMYYDPYPYGYATSTTGNHLVGGSGTLSLIAAPSSYFSAQGYTWGSAAVSTYGLVEIPVEGGYVQFHAKMPDSRYGAWAALWFLSSVGAEIDLMESGYTSGAINANRIMSMNWHGGGSQQIVDTGVDLSAGYHTYGMEFKPGVSIKMYLDGVLQTTYTTSIPTGVTYQVIMDVEVANSTASGFHTVSDTVLHPGPFQHDIDNVQIYSLAISP